MTNNSHDAREPKLTGLLLADIRRGDFKRTLRRDWHELKDFYLDQERQSRLASMGRIRRWLVTTWWLLKSLFLKLTPARRVLLLVSLVLLLSSNTMQHDQQNVQFVNDTKVFGFVILLFILMLELKDKLLAQSELAAGRSVQRALMPKTNPIVPGWEIWMVTQPANEVSGDWVDYLELGGQRCGFALGDVSGKGLKAALLMVKLQATLRALAADFTSLAELGKKLNAILRRDGLPDSFASLVYLELQPASGRVRLLNAGHMPPLLLKGSRVKEMPHPAAALGVAPDLKFVEQTVEMKKGDVLLIYSDGLTEARDEAGEFFGEERFLSLLPECSRLAAHEIGARILAEVASFVGDARAFDDLSLIVLKRVGMNE